MKMLAQYDFREQMETVGNIFGPSLNYNMLSLLASRCDQQAMLLSILFTQLSDNWAFCLSLKIQPFQNLS